MTDTYLDLVNSGLTRTAAKKLGLPRPAVLRRHRPGDPLVPGPVLVLHDAASEADANALATQLLGWDLDVHRHGTTQDGFAAVVVVLTEVATPSELGEPMLRVAGVLRGLLPGGRVVTVSRSPSDGKPAPATAAARQGIDGMLRSLAKELRGGSTGNGIVLTEGATVSSPSALGTLRFLLSARSAFVDGQLVQVAPGGQVPADWEHPLAGKVALVTGAARGIGAEIARTLARDGATLVVVDVPAAGDRLAAVANDVRGTALQLDVTSPDATARILAHVTARHGRLDIVVHNAGILRDKLLVNMVPEKWDPVIAVNVTAPLRITEELLASGHLGSEPRVVCLASTSGIAGNRGQTNYGASKAGVIGMVRAYAPELAEAGGTITAVAPGFIETDMTARIPFAMREMARRLSSLQQGGQPIDVAETVALLASPQAGGLNGQVVRVCGQNPVGQ